MDKQYKRKVFSLLADKFETDKFRDYFLDMCEEVPDYIFTMPSSTSGKYHNPKQCERFGQLYHIFMFASVLEHLLRLEHVKEFAKNEEIRDAMRCVPVFHDAIKCGWNGSQYTVQDHPILAQKWVMETKVKHDIDDKIKTFIGNMCAAHSGEWNKNRKGEEIMPKPSNSYEKLIHECDIIASRPDLDYVIPDELLKILGEDKGEDLPDIDTYKMPFGKYKGMTLKEIQLEDPGWITWAKNEMKKEPIASLVRSM